MNRKKTRIFSIVMSVLMASGASVSSNVHAALPTNLLNKKMVESDFADAYAKSDSSLAELIKQKEKLIKRIDTTIAPISTERGVTGNPNSVPDNSILDKIKESIQSKSKEKSAIEFPSIDIAQNTLEQLDLEQIVEEELQNSKNAINVIDTSIIINSESDQQQIEEEIRNLEGTISSISQSNFIKSPQQQVEEEIRRLEDMVASIVQSNSFISESQQQPLVKERPQLQSNRFELLNPINPNTSLTSLLG